MCPYDTEKQRFLCFLVSLPQIRDVKAHLRSFRDEPCWNKEETYFAYFRLKLTSFRIKSNNAPERCFPVWARARPCSVCRCQRRSQNRRTKIAQQCKLFCLFLHIKFRSTRRLKIRKTSNCTTNCWRLQNPFNSDWASSAHELRTEDWINGFTQDFNLCVGLWLLIPARH